MTCAPVSQPPDVGRGGGRREPPAANRIARAMMPCLVAAWALCGQAWPGGVVTEVAPTENPPGPAKAVFIIVDGVPADVIERVETPFLDDLAKAGGYARARVGGPLGEPGESPTVSAVGYMSLLTGTWANKHNVRRNYFINPDYRYWDLFRIAKAQSQPRSTAIFSTWTDNRTKLLGDGQAEAGGAKLDYAFDGFEDDTRRFPHDSEESYIRDIDALVSAEAAKYIATHAPDLSWIYLQHTDDVAHEHGDSAIFDQAVNWMDSRIGLVWSAVKRRQAEYNEDWLILVTTDHGRDAETGRDHGKQSPRERTIWIATNSKRLNASFEEEPWIVDILPSIATHMGFEIPAAVQAQLDGQSFID